VPVLHFILLTAVAHDDLKPVYTHGHAVSKNQQNRSTRKQNRTKFITYNNTYIGQPISNKMVEEA
jgi:hypothetical protein